MGGKSSHKKHQNSGASGKIQADSETLQENNQSQVQAKIDQPKVKEGIDTSSFAKWQRALAKLLNDLRGCGASLDVDVPRIAILGNQSAGKSSVVESVSGVNLPRSQGTCTRCPMEVRLTPSNEDWRCKVFLRFSKNSDGSFRSTVVEQPFGEVMHDPSEVEERLRRAQLAILNPSKPADSFLAHDYNIVNPPKPEVSFSDNCVCIDVSGPDLTNLSFVDLPEDIQTQFGAGLTREVDPNLERTIGVLTKTDLLMEGELRRWQDILQGKIEPMKHGYFAVCNPAVQQLEDGISFEQARENERAQFRQPKWASLPPQFIDRLGTEKLVKRLSRLLEQLVQKKLPSLIQQFQDLHEDVVRELEKLPKEIKEDEAVAVVGRMCQSFARDLDEATLGSCNRADFIHKLRNGIFARYRNNISVTMNDLIEEIGKDALEFIDCVMTIEESIDTSNIHDYLTLKDKMLQALLKRRELISEKQLEREGYPEYEIRDIREKNADLVKSALALLIEAGHSTDVISLKARPGENSEEMTIGSEMMSYWKIAFKRVIDTIPGIMDSLFSRRVAQACLEAIQISVGIHSENAKEICMRYVAEQEDLKNLRNEYKAKKDRLKQGLVAISNFQRAGHRRNA
ncbi:P-loop containing nucleoside triphosphate hydrolase protein [Violaceomyces palustris]|uniref:P-loop containing nucleoside triphosphate hydrolase protein n=1 Tax=Violaceomyces palustris TaxID=1673888 RepID=A0ACD0P7M9_9BASI|nr:P-loop containing nucleoside triphosphate hydrolase protein [Violaceomyces palustris]